MRQTWLFIWMSVISMIPLCRIGLTITTLPSCSLTSIKEFINLQFHFQFQPLFCSSLIGAPYELLRNVSCSTLHLLQDDKFTMAISLSSCLRDSCLPFGIQYYEMLVVHIQYLHPLKVFTPLALFLFCCIKTCNLNRFFYLDFI